MDDSGPQKYDQSDNLIQNASTPIATTRARSHLKIKSKNLKQSWFIRNEERECDSNSYNNGGLGRCERERSKAKLPERMTQFLQDKKHKFQEAATSLQM